MAVEERTFYVMLDSEDETWEGVQVTKRRNNTWYFSVNNPAGSGRLDIESSDRNKIISKAEDYLTLANEYEEVRAQFEEKFYKVRDND